MENYKDYDKKLESNIKRNEKFLKAFEEWLNEQNLANKTIKKHLNNVSLYINDFLNYYDIKKMEEGVNFIYDFFDGWFIEKCLWASKSSLKTTSSSIKKFYKCMADKGYITEEDYKTLYCYIKENMDEFLEQIDAYDDGTYYDMSI